MPTHSYRAAHATLALLVALLAAVAALSLSEEASAATPCAKKVLADWFDNGRIDRLYPLHCYEEAIDAIPSDIRDYANAEDVISRALQSALRGQLAPGGPDPTPGDGSTDNGSTGGNNGGTNSGGTDTGTDPPGSSEAVPEVDTSGPSSLPLPLLVLGGLALALLAAGGIGYLSRRRQGRAPGE